MWDYFTEGIITREVAPEGRGGAAFCVSKDPSAYKFKHSMFAELLEFEVKKLKKDTYV